MGHTEKYHPRHKSLKGFVKKSGPRSVVSERSGPALSDVLQEVVRVLLGAQAQISGPQELRDAIDGCHVEAWMSWRGLTDHCHPSWPSTTFYHPVSQMDMMDLKNLTLMGLTDHWSGRNEHLLHNLKAAP